MTVHYLDLSHYLAIAGEVTALDTGILIRAANLDIADSALHAPGAGWAGEAFSRALIDQAALLVVRLAKNHPLPGGHKRAAWVALRLFLEINGWRRCPSVEDAEESHGRHRLQHVGREARRCVACFPAGTAIGIMPPKADPSADRQRHRERAGSLRYPARTATSSFGSPLRRQRSSVRRGRRRPRSCWLLAQGAC